MEYQFSVAGVVSEELQAAFPELTAGESATGETTLIGALDDYSDVRGLLARFDDLGLQVVEMRQITPDNAPGHGPTDATREDPSYG